MDDGTELSDEEFEALMYLKRGGSGIGMNEAVSTTLKEMGLAEPKLGGIRITKFGRQILLRELARGRH